MEDIPWEDENRADLITTDEALELLAYYDSLENQIAALDYALEAIKIDLVTSGQHHISVAALRKTGKMHAEVHLIRDILRRYTGNAVGLWDKGAHRGRGVLVEGVNPRLCLLLEIYREKYHLQNKLAVQQREKGKIG